MEVVAEKAAAQQRLLLTHAEGGTGGCVRLDIELPNIRRRWAEIVFPLSFSVAEMKEKICRHTGLSAAAAGALRVYLRFSASDHPGTFLGDDFKTLKDYGCVDGCTLFVEYEAEAAGEGFAAAVASAEAAEAAAEGRSDFSGKYIMPDEEYDQRQGTVRKFLQHLRQHQEKQKNQQQQSEKKQQQQEQSEQQQQRGGPEGEVPQQHQEGANHTEMKICGEQQEAAADHCAATAAERLAEAKDKYRIGLRCRLVGDRRGDVAYVGPRPSRPQHEIWIGVALDEPMGSTDGCDFAAASTRANNTSISHVSVSRGSQQKVRPGQKGVKLFDCNGDRYGEFALMEEVELGEFPPLDPFDLIDEI